jgi:hypothetical protein
MKERLSHADRESRSAHLAEAKANYERLDRSIANYPDLSQIPTASAAYRARCSEELGQLHARRAVALKELERRAGHPVTVEQASHIPVESGPVHTTSGGRESEAEPAGREDEREDEYMPSAAPQSSLFLLRFLPTTRENREGIIGDLLEEFEDVSRDHGVGKARFWFGWMTFASFASLLWSRVPGLVSFLRRWVLR